MTDVKMEQDAHEFAKEAHKGQVDDDGLSYFEAHLCHVANIIRACTNDSEMVAAAYLHDTIEDAGVQYPVLVAKFGQRVADLVNELTHEGKKDQHGYYFPRLKSRDAIVIKLADRMSNLSRMDVWPRDRQEQYLEKTKFWRSA